MAARTDWRFSNISVINKCHIKYMVLSICNDCYEKRNTDLTGLYLTQNLRNDFKFSSVAYYNLPENSVTIKNLVEHSSNEIKVDVIFAIGGPGYLRHLTPIVDFHTADHVYENPTMMMYGIIEKILIAKGLICGIINQTIVINFPHGNLDLESKYTSARTTVPVMQEILMLANTDLLSMDSAKVLSKLAFHAYSVRTIIRIPTITALEYYSAESVVSEKSHPETDESMKNGFAFKHTDCDKSHLKKICTVEEINERDDKTLGTNECVFISPGKTLIAGANCVVEFKSTRRIRNHPYDENNMIEILIPTYEYLNVKRAGQDIEANEMVVKKGSAINAEQLGILVKIGKVEIAAYSKPNIGIISAVNRWSKEKLENSIFDSSNSMLRIYFERNYLMCTDYGIIHGNIADVIEKGLKESDIVVICHNVMMADKDDTIALLKNRFKAKFYYENINMSPSAAFAHCEMRGEQKYVFVLFGNPLSMLMICQTLIISSIKYWMGKNDHDQRQIKVQLREDVQLTQERRYLRAMVEYASASDCPIAVLIEERAQLRGTEVFLELPAENDTTNVISAGTTINAFVCD